MEVLHHRYITNHQVEQLEIKTIEEYFKKFKQKLISNPIWSILNQDALKTIFAQSQNQYLNDQYREAIIRFVLQQTEYCFLIARDARAVKKYSEIEIQEKMRYFGRKWNKLRKQIEAYNKNFKQIITQVIENEDIFFNWKKIGINDTEIDKIKDHDFIKIIARHVKEMCSLSTKPFLFLSNYLYQICKQTEKKIEGSIKQKKQKIQKLLSDILHVISQNHRSTLPIDKENPEYNSIIEQIGNFDRKKQAFYLQEILSDLKLGFIKGTKCSQVKQQIIKNLILPIVDLCKEKGRIQKKFQDLNEEFFHEKGISFHSNRKIKNQKDQKGTKRVLEKFIFSKQKSEDQNTLKNQFQRLVQNKWKLIPEQCSDKYTLDKYIETQNQEYKQYPFKFIEQKVTDFEGKQKNFQLTFQVSDMIRSKCSFSSLTQLYQCYLSILSILQYQEGKNNENSPNTLNIYYLQTTNRLKTVGDMPPTSDVVIKILIGNIITQIQLVLDVINENDCRYNFGHKIYQLSRPKIASKFLTLKNFTNQLSYEYLKQIQQFIKKKFKQDQINGKIDYFKSKILFSSETKVYDDEINQKYDKLKLQICKLYRTYQQQQSQSIFKQFKDKNQFNLKIWNAYFFVQTEKWQKTSELTTSSIKKEILNVLNGKSKFNTNNKINNKINQKQEFERQFFLSFDEDTNSTKQSHHFPQVQNKQPKVQNRQQTYPKNTWRQAFMIAKLQGIIYKSRNKNKQAIGAFTTALQFHEASSQLFLDDIEYKLESQIVKRLTAICYDKAQQNDLQSKQLAKKYYYQCYNYFQNQQSIKQIKQYLSCNYQEQQQLIKKITNELRNKRSNYYQLFHQGIAFKKIGQLKASQQNKYSKAIKMLKLSINIQKITAIIPIELSRTYGNLGKILQDYKKFRMNQQQQQRQYYQSIQSKIDDMIYYNYKKAIVLFSRETGKTTQDFSIVLSNLGGFLSKSYESPHDKQKLKESYKMLLMSVDIRNKLKNQEKNIIPKLKTMINLYYTVAKLAEVQKINIKYFNQTRQLYEQLKQLRLKIRVESPQKNKYFEKLDKLSDINYLLYIKNQDKGQQLFLPNICDINAISVQTTPLETITDGINYVTKYDEIINQPKQLNNKQLLKAIGQYSFLLQIYQRMPQQADDKLFLISKSTSTLIPPNTLLTTAHTIMPLLSIISTNIEWPKNKFKVLLIHNKKQFQIQFQQKGIYHPTNCNKIQDDWALIKFQVKDNDIFAQKINKLPKLNFLYLDTHNNYTKYSYKRMPCFLQGYYSKDDCTYSIKVDNETQLYYSNGDFKIRDNIIQHSINTTRNTSGSALFMMYSPTPSISKNQIYMVGMHTSSCERRKINYGCTFNLQFINNLQNLCNQDTKNPQFQNKYIQIKERTIDQKIQNIADIQEQFVVNRNFLIFSQQQLVQKIIIDKQNELLKNLLKQMIELEQSQIFIKKISFENFLFDNTGSFKFELINLDNEKILYEPIQQIYEQLFTKQYIKYNFQAYLNFIKTICQKIPDSNYLQTIVKQSQKAGSLKILKQLIKPNVINRQNLKIIPQYYDSVKNVQLNIEKKINHIRRNFQHCQHKLTKQDFQYMLIKHLHTLKKEIQNVQHPQFNNLKKWALKSKQCKDRKECQILAPQFLKQIRKIFIDLISKNRMFYRIPKQQQQTIDIVELYQNFIIQSYSLRLGSCLNNNNVVQKLILIQKRYCRTIFQIQLALIYYEKLIKKKFSFQAQPIQKMTTTIIPEFKNHLFPKINQQQREQFKYEQIINPFELRNESYQPFSQFIPVKITDPLYNYIGQIGYYRRSKSNKNWVGRGTGTLIYRNIVLTAYHIIQANPTNQIRLWYFKLWKLRLDQCQHLEETKIYRYKNLEKSDNNPDVAFLQLQQNVLQNQQIFKIGYNIEQNATVYVEIIGFPKIGSQKKNIIEKRLYKSSGLINLNNQDEQIFEHKIFTTNKMSGSPVLLKLSQNRSYVIGVQKQGTLSANHYNKGEKITKYIEDQRMQKKWQKLNEDVQILNPDILDQLIFKDLKSPFNEEEEFKNNMKSNIQRYYCVGDQSYSFFYFKLLFKLFQYWSCGIDFSILHITNIIVTEQTIRLHNRYQKHKTGKFDYIIEKCRNKQKSSIFLTKVQELINQYQQLRSQSDKHRFNNICSIEKYKQFGYIPPHFDKKNCFINQINNLKDKTFEGYLQYLLIFYRINNQKKTVQQRYSNEIENDLCELHIRRLKNLSEFYKDGVQNARLKQIFKRSQQLQLIVEVDWKQQQSLEASTLKKNMFLGAQQKAFNHGQVKQFLSTICQKQIRKTLPQQVSTFLLSELNAELDHKQIIQRRNLRLNNGDNLPQYLKQYQIGNYQNMHLNKISPQVLIQNCYTWKFQNYFADIVGEFKQNEKKQLQKFFSKNNQLKKSQYSKDISSMVSKYSNYFDKNGISSLTVINILEEFSKLQYDVKWTIFRDNGVPQIRDGRGFFLNHNIFMVKKPVQITQQKVNHKFQLQLIFKNQQTFMKITNVQTKQIILDQIKSKSLYIFINLESQKSLQKDFNYSNKRIKWENIYYKNSEIFTKQNIEIIRGKGENKQPLKKQRLNFSQLKIQAEDQGIIIIKENEKSKIAGFIAHNQKKIFSIKEFQQIRQYYPKQFQSEKQIQFEKSLQMFPFLLKKIYELNSNYLGLDSSESTYWSSGMILELIYREEQQKYVKILCPFLIYIQDKWESEEIIIPDIVKTFYNSKIKDYNVIINKEYQLQVEKIKQIVKREKIYQQKYIWDKFQNILMQLKQIKFDNLNLKNQKNFKKLPSQMRNLLEFVVQTQKIYEENKRYLEQFQKAKTHVQNMNSYERFSRQANIEEKISNLLNQLNQIRQMSQSLLNSPFIQKLSYENVVIPNQQSSYFQRINYLMNQILESNPFLYQLYKPIKQIILNFTTYKNLKDTINKISKLINLPKKVQMSHLVQRFQINWPKDEKKQINIFQKYLKRRTQQLVELKIQSSLSPKKLVTQYLNNVIIKFARIGLQPISTYADHLPQQQTQQTKQVEQSIQTIYAILSDPQKQQKQIEISSQILKNLKINDGEFNHKVNQIQKHIQTQYNEKLRMHFRSENILQFIKIQLKYKFVWAIIELKAK